MRKLICLLLVLIAIFSFAGCGAKDKEQEKGTQQITENTTHKGETEEKNKNTSIKELKEFSIKVDKTNLKFPVSYAEFKKQIEVDEMTFISNTKGYYEPDWTIDMSCRIGNKHTGYIFLKNTTGENVTSIDEFTVTGLQLKPEDDIELEIYVKKDDAVDTLKERFGEPDFENTEVPLLYYSVPNITINGEPFGVEFWLNHNNNTLKHIKIGSFKRIYKE